MALPVEITNEIVVVGEARGVHNEQLLFACEEANPMAPSPGRSPRHPPEALGKVPHNEIRG